MEDTAPIALQSVVESPKDRAPIDEFGRVYGTAIRKKLRAHVWLSPAKPTTRDAQLESSGQLLIDGHDYKLILTHMRDRYILSRAFHPRLLGAHNVFVQLESAHADKQQLYTKQLVPQSNYPAIGSEMGLSNIRDSIVAATSRAMVTLLQSIQSSNKHARGDASFGDNRDASAIAKGISVTETAWLSELTAQLRLVAGDEEYMQLLESMSREDARQHERKKTGQPSARAQFQWVKR